MRGILKIDVRKLNRAGGPRSKDGISLSKVNTEYLSEVISEKTRGVETGSLREIRKVDEHGVPWLDEHGVPGWMSTEYRVGLRQRHADQAMLNINDDEQADNALNK